ncbi:hypothetical protein [Micromonospora auratinigra]|uniref:Uncharacterized protein n=1 Tax=Micromonospora auratinigra TaxID=261654 RepID=A0A1A8ZAK9_9ACTN|nr:hypothetical protein [Micromonospora auratinigra]SBT40904.1 hypothetical protein GA0070611_1429 [Micromonospora auratinigra]
MTGPDDAEVAYLRQVTALARDLVAADDPYEPALEISGVSAQASLEVEPAGYVWLIWGDLTDRMELRPDEDEQSAAEMLRAARAWLALDLTDRAAVAGYLEHWVHDVCGYARRTGSDAG